VGALIGGLDLDEDGVIEAEEFVSAWTLFIGSVPAKRVSILYTPRPASAPCQNIVSSS